RGAISSKQARSSRSSGAGLSPPFHARHWVKQTRLTLTDVVRTSRRVAAMRLSSIWKLMPAIALGAMFATVLAIPNLPVRAQARPDRILYFTHSAGYRHEVIPASREILRQLGEISPRFEVVATEDAEIFTAENLRRFGAIMFFTTGELP